MPTSARKSSIGQSRRGPQKAHIPYRGDNPEVGKKTGITVQHVERKSDGFEPFEELMQRADGLTPPQKKGRKKSMAIQQDDDFDEEDGEQSMQLESPVQHLVNLRTPVSPPTVSRRSSIRPIPRSSAVDFDQLPSPREMSAVHRSGRNGGPGPSGLSRAGSHREPEPPSGSPNGGPSYGGGEYDDNMFDSYEPREDDSPQNLRGETSFSRIEQDGDEEDEEEEEEEDPEEALTSRRRQEKGKGKAKEVWHDQDEGEDEIADGLEDVDQGPESDVSHDTRPQKKAKEAPVKRDKAVKSQRKKENKPPREGTRRSQRKPLKPFAYWRGERYVYGRDEDHSGPVLVPPIKEVIRIPEGPHAPLSKKRKRAFTRQRSESKSRGVEPVEDKIPPALPVVNPEEGWDDKTEAKCVVLHYTSREEVERRIVWTAKMVQPKMAAENTWFFDKIFGDDDFIAAGQLLIPPNGRKPSKAAKDNTYVFYVIEGAVNFKIHLTSMVVATGGMFMVPRGNFYMIENICNRDARLFFTQARKVEMDSEEIAAKEAQAAEAQKKRLSGRSSSVGATPTVKVALPNGRAASLAAMPSK